MLSLTKRDKMRYLLKAIAEKPGMSNRELASARELKKSAVSRYMQVLTAKGIVDRRLIRGGSLAYSINDKLPDCVNRAVRQEKN